MKESLRSQIESYLKKLKERESLLKEYEKTYAKNENYQEARKQQIKAGQLNIMIEELKTILN